MNPKNDFIREYLGVDKWHKSGYTGKRGLTLTAEKIPGTDHAKKTLAVFHEIAPERDVRFQQFYDTPSQAQIFLDGVRESGADTMYMSLYVNGNRSKAGMEILKAGWPEHFSFFACAGNDGGNSYNAIIEHDNAWGVGAVEIRWNAMYGDGTPMPNAKLLIIPAGYTSEDDDVDFAAPTNLYLASGASFSGTSCATPVLCGMAALVNDFFIDKTGKPLPHEAMYRFLREHSEDVSDKGKDKYTGYGLPRLPDPDSIDVWAWQVKEPEPEKEEQAEPKEEEKAEQQEGTAMEKYVRVPRERVSRIELYINSGKKSLAEIIKETGASYAINGGLYDMAKFQPVCHLRANGYTLAEDEYNYFGLGWNNAETAFALVTAHDKEKVDNYICCVEIVHQGRKNEPLIMDAAQEGRRARTVAGFYENGDTFLYCATGVQSPEELRDRVAGLGVYEALMLDGGGSTQCYFAGEELVSSRKVHNLILVYLKEEEMEDDVKHDTDTGNYKIALGAGHGINSAGKRCLKSLDPNETREWWLNDRVCDYIAEYLQDYERYELMRTDDADDGQDNIDLSVRAAAANKWGADIYISIHHNAGINGGTGGGIVAFSHPDGSAESHEWRDELYEALIAHTGLKGNRWDGTLTANYQILRETDMPAVLLELGFMDSKTDVPIILTDEHARKCANAIVEVLAKRGKLKKKDEAQEKDGAIYRVQLGAFSNAKNAEALAAQLKAAGYQVYITKT